MQRRSFTASILAAGSAPALAKAGWLMPSRAIVLPSLPPWAQWVGDAVVPVTTGLVRRGPDGWEWVKFDMTSEDYQSFKRFMS
jgi:hypothetical protein